MSGSYVEHFRDDIEALAGDRPVNAKGCCETDKRSPRASCLYNILSACIAGFMGGWLPITSFGFYGETVLPIFWIQFSIVI